jgi:hypothetical protein
MFRRRCRSRHLGIVPFVAVALALAPSVASAGVSVHKTKVVVVRKTFDRRDPPKDMPPLGPRADAVTHLKFGCSASAAYEVTSRRHDTSRRRGPGSAGCTATAVVNDLDVRVDLEITIWVPRGARQKLIDHEEGHRVIGERAYETAERAAREAARRWIGKSVTGTAANCAAAADAAVREVNEQLCKSYLEATSGWSSRVGDRYDDITDHGRRDNPPVAEAIELAFERDAADRDADLANRDPAVRGAQQRDSVEQNRTRRDARGPSATSGTRE